MSTWQLPGQRVPIHITMLSSTGALNVCTATPRPMCPRTHHNAIQYWYLKCVHGNSQGQPVPVHITMLFSISTLNVCTATSRPMCPHTHHKCCPVLVP